MNKNIIIAAVIGVLVLGGGTFVLLSNSDSNDNSNASQQNTGDASIVSTTDNPLGLDVSAVSGPYRINIMTSEVNGRATDAVADVDADGNISTTITDNGQVSTFILINGETYVKAPDQDTFTKFPASDSSPIDTSDINVGFTQEDVDEINNLNIIDKGTGTCTNGSCRIYEYTDPETSDTGTVKVTTDTNRLSDIEITSADGGEVQMSYDYSAAINITAPENFVEFEIPNINDIDLDSVLENAPQQ